MSLRNSTPDSLQPDGRTDASASGLTMRSGVWLLLIGALLALGLAPLAMPESYSWFEHGTSESAAQDIDGAWVARTGFILLGLAVIRVARLRSQAWRSVGTVLHLGFAVSMFAVAAFSTRPWQEEAAYVESEDFFHSVFATSMGFGFIGGVVAVMIAKQDPCFRAALSDVAALAVTIAVPLAMSTGSWGLLQRAKFVTAAIWYGNEARLNQTEPWLEDRLRQ